MKLALLKQFARRRYAVNGPGMGTGHGQRNDDAFVLRNHLEMFKFEARKSLAEPPAGGDQACGASDPPIRSIGIVIRLPVDEIRRDDSLRCHRVAGLDYAKDFDRHLLVLLQGHRPLHLLLFFKADTDTKRLPGAVVMIARHGKVVYYEAFGVRDPATGAPMQKDSIFRIYSMTKPITGVAVLMLMEEGKLRLSDPISKYLPALKN